MHIEKTAEIRTAGDVWLRGDFGNITRPCELHERQVRAKHASERLYDRDFRGRISTHPHAGTVTFPGPFAARRLEFQLTPTRGR